MEKLKPIVYIHDFLTRSKYPVYLESDLIINNPIFSPGEIVFTSPTINIRREYLKYKIGDGSRAYNDLPFVYTDNTDLSSDYTVNVNFNINEALMLSRICRNTITDKYNTLDTIDTNDIESISKINTEISLLKECRNKIKKSINTIYGECAKKYIECEE